MAPGVILVLCLDQDAFEAFQDQHGNCVTMLQYNLPCMNFVGRNRVLAQPPPPLRKAGPII